jgi:CheY-like chemotaxis protein
MITDDDFLSALAGRLNSHLEPMRDALARLGQSADAADLAHHLRELEQLADHLENLARITGHRGGRRILVVDDDRDFADNLAVVLRREGYSVTVAYSGREALESAGTAMLDAVLLDIRMPVVSGYDTARVFRRHPPATRPVLIGVTQWQIEDKDRLAAKEAGFDHFTAKPKSDAALADLLSRISERKQPPASGR